MRTIHYLDTNMHILCVYLLFMHIYIYVYYVHVYVGVDVYEYICVYL